MVQLCHQICQRDGQRVEIIAKRGVAGAQIRPMIAGDLLVKLAAFEAAHGGAEDIEQLHSTGVLLLVLPLQRIRFRELRAQVL